MASLPSSSTSAPPPPTQTYTSLKAELFALGQKLATVKSEHPSRTYTDRIEAALTYLMSVPVDALVLFPGTDWSDLDTPALDEAADDYRKAGDKKKRARTHRALMEGTDEQFSTAGIENLLVGITAAPGWTQATYDIVYKALTWARLPTCMTAIDAVINGQHVRMVHPAQRTDSTLTKTKGGTTASITVEGHSSANAAGIHSVTGHRDFDIERAALAVHVGHILASDPAMPLEGILCEMLHAVISYTLQFVAPPFAAGVNFTQPLPVQSAAHSLREAEKCAANLLHHATPSGSHTGTQALTDPPRGRQPYVQGQTPSKLAYSRPRSPSPPRK